MLSFCLVKNVKMDNCINIEVRDGLVYCSNCSKYVGLCAEANDSEIITFVNVRESLFRPHTSYSRYSTEGDYQYVSFMERVEIGSEAVFKPFSALDFLLYANQKDCVEVDQNMPSTSSAGNLPFIRVAAFASESAIYNESRVLAHFQNAIQNDQDLSLKFSDPNDEQFESLFDEIGQEEFQNPSMPLLD